MNDRELLELAAKAVGMEGYRWVEGSNCFTKGANWFLAKSMRPDWNPLTDDGDALRLAVKLGIEVTPFLSGACAVTTPDGWKRTESGYESGIAATRRAIVRAAAEIGKAMP